MAKSWSEVKEALKDIYPGMSKAVFSMGKNPTYYGIRLTRRAEILADITVSQLENRKNPCRLYLRVNRDLYKTILGRLDGRSVQEYLLDLVEKDVSQTRSAGGERESA